MATRSLWLPAGVDRDLAENDRTVVGDLPSPHPETHPGSVPEIELSFAELFAAHFDALRAAVARHAGRVGVAIVAIDARGVRGELWVERPEDDGLRTAIVGRHGQADLFLAGDPALSLRHLAVLVRGPEGDGSPRIRVLDLRTSLRFSDESGRRLDAVESAGPLFLAVSRYRLFCFPTGAGSVAWPADAAEAWRALPPRVFADARSEAAAPPVARMRPLRRAVPPAGDREPTVVTSCDGIVPLEIDFHRLAGAGEDVLGHLVLDAGGRSVRVAVGRIAGERGVLIGRYGRCELGGGLDRLGAGWNGGAEGLALSRVHALLVHDEGRTWLVDTASSNGTTVDGARIACRALARGESACLARWMLARWEPAQ